MHYHMKLPVAMDIGNLRYKIILSDVNFTYISCLMYQHYNI